MAIESVGGGSFTAARRRVRPDGVVLWFGQAGGEPITVDFFEWIDGTVGSPIVPFAYARSDGQNAADLATLVRLVHEGRLHPEVGSVQTWDHTAETIADIRARRLRGNAVLAVAA